MIVESPISSYESDLDWFLRCFWERQYFQCGEKLQWKEMGTQPFDLITTRQENTYFHRKALKSLSENITWNIQYTFDGIYFLAYKSTQAVNRA
jgi:hypothetical protein